MGNWDLPATLREIAEVIGRERALVLAGKVVDWSRHGRRGRSGELYVPRSDRPCRLDSLLPDEEARKLREAFPGELLKISLPTQPIRRFRDDTARRLRNEGWGYEGIAKALGISERRARQIVGA